MRRENERLQDILNAIAAIEKYTDRGKQVFDNEELIQVWIIYHLQIIGEAANDLSEVLKDRYSVIPWQQIIGLRNLLVHEYFRIDKQLVWDIALKDLPLLKKTTKVMLNNINSN
jgi:uncharacterized protein with HEPN domain